MEQEAMMTAEKTEQEGLLEKPVRPHKRFSSARSILLLFVWGGIIGAFYFCIRNRSASVWTVMSGLLVGWIVAALVTFSIGLIQNSMDCRANRTDQKPKKE